MECNKHNSKRVKPLDEECKKRDNRNKRLAEGCTSLMYACQRGNTGAIVKELRTKSNTVRHRDRSNKSVLHYCSGQRDPLIASVALSVAPDLMESADEDGFTPLHLAVIQGNMAMINLLLANKADVNALDNEGHSAVHWATVCGEVDALRAILAAGANITADINGGSPLHYAAQMCGANYEGKGGQSSSKLALEILDILLAHPKSSVDLTDKDNRQPLSWAASAGSAKAVIALVKAGARVESADKDGLTALHCAASRGHTECIDTIISLCGAPTDIIDSNGCTALHYAVTLGHADATARLLDLEADPNRQDRKGRTPAHCGCAKGQFETVKLLKERDGNLWLRNARGDLPVHEAAASGRRELVEWLLEQKPKQINTTSNDGRTFLHIAAGNDYMDMCKMLLDFGADINCIFRNSKGVVMTPLDCALQKGFRSTAKFLQSNGGLPASKLRLSARRPNAFNDQELVKPLKYSEKEEVHDLKNAKKYVVYVKRSDSECSCSEQIYKKDRKINHICKHHRKKFRRRTSSCGETKLKDDDSSSDICRSKSNIEIRRVTSHDRSYSSDEDSCENCCHHRKKIRQRRKDRSSKKTKALLPLDTDANINMLSEEARDKVETEQTHIENRSELIPKVKQDDENRPQSAKRMNQKEATFIKNSVPLQAQQLNVSVQMDLTDEDDQTKSETVVTQAEVHITSEMEETITVSNEKDEIVEEVSFQVNEVLTDAVAVVDNISDGIKVELRESETSIEERKDEKMEKPPDGKQDIDYEKLETDQLESANQAVESINSKQKMVLNDNKETTDGKHAQSENVEKSDVVKKEKHINGHEHTKSVSPALETTITGEPKLCEEASIQEKPGPCRTEEGRKSFTLLSESPLVDEQPRKSSFTVLKSDESVDIEEAIDHYGQGENRSFHLMETKIIKDHSDVDYSSDDLGQEEEGNESCVSAMPTASAYTKQMTQRPSSAGICRKKRLKRRVKTVDKTNKKWTKEGGQQASKDQDSGFEPSPRAMKTKIPSPRTIHTAVLPRRPIYATLDGRSCSSRLEGRKPGERNACNMTAVTRSIQRNIRRYYMEKKIFQHLLELKSLQIRSTKVNEFVLVKRAVDDYHKSCIALGAETGGTLRRYPYSDYTFKNFEIFLYETLKSLQKSGTYNFQNINEVYKEAERRLSPDYSSYEKALHCTTKTHRCLHAAHAYTGIPCAAYIPMMNHHTMPKYGFGPYKKLGVGSFYLPKILTTHTKSGGKVSLELSHGKNKQLISLPSDKLDSNKRYYVTFTVKGAENDGKDIQDEVNYDKK